MIRFHDRLARACEAAGSRLCVGLDPRPERLSEPVADFCKRIIDATAEHAAAFKPNSAFFEALGLDGYRILREVIDHVPEERILLLDAKRGDMAATSEAYARAVFQVLGADAVTVSPYLGGEALEPFLADPARGAFVLCHTSNPGAEELQGLALEGGEPLYLRVARRAEAWSSRANVGLVVGATYPEALARVRAAAPSLPFLVPGIGAQGGDLAGSVRAGLDAAGGGLLISASRSVMFAPDPGAAARELSEAVEEARAAALSGQGAPA